jgi:hypothetical protein
MHLKAIGTMEAAFGCVVIGTWSRNIIYKYQRNITCVRALFERRLEPLHVIVSMHYFHESLSIKPQVKCGL